MHKLGIEDHLITSNSVRLLKAALNNSYTLIDGLRHPYQFLLPFLILGCHSLARLDEVDGFDHEDYRAEVLAEEALHEAAKMVSPIASLVNAP